MSIDSEKEINAMDLTAIMAVSEIAKETNQSESKVLLDFMKSHTAEILYDSNLKLWWDGPSSVASSFLNEIKNTVSR